MSRRCSLIAGVGVLTGNNVSHSNRKTRRRFLPNLCQTSFASEALGVNLNLKVAASTLRTVNKYGNIDNFLVNFRFANLTAEAQKLRRKVVKALTKKEKLAEIKVTSRKKSTPAS